MRRMLKALGAALASAGLMVVPAAADPGAEIVSIDLAPMSCHFDVVFQVVDAGTYAVNLWDDGSFIAGVADTFPEAATVTVRVTIGGAALSGASGIGVYVEDAVGMEATVNYDANGSYQYPDEIGNACQVLGYTFGTEVVSVVTPTTTSTSTSSTTSTSSSTSSTTLPSELLAGKKLLLKATRLVLVSKDRSVTAGGGARSGDDPTVAGGTLRLVGTGFERSFTLPPSAWSLLSEKKPEKGYRLAGATPISAIVFKPGKLVKIVAKGDALAIPLDADIAPVRAELQMGARRWCFEFGGSVAWKAGKQWLATKAPAASSCPPL